MAAVLYKYRIVIVVLCLIALGFIAWLFLSRQELGKIPSRGVFVNSFNCIDILNKTA